jgi:hypothetical protein
MMSKFEKLLVALFALGTIYMVSVSTGQSAAQPEMHAPVDSVRAHKAA